MNKEDLEQIMDKEGFIDTLYGKTDIKPFSSLLQHELYKNLTFKKASQMLVYVERTEDDKYHIATYMPKKEF